MPKQADLRNELALLPRLKILLEIRQQIFHERIVRMDHLHRPDRIGKPAAISPRLRAGRAKPIAEIIAGDPRLAEPAGLVKLMPGRATDGPISAGPEWPIDELGHSGPALNSVNE